MSQLLSVSPVIPYIVLVIGFILLVKGADYFVEGCSGIAKLFHIPTIIIGLTVAAFGTSAPEAAVSIIAALTSPFLSFPMTACGQTLLSGRSK